MSFRTLVVVLVLLFGIASSVLAEPVDAPTPEQIEEDRQKLAASKAQELMIAAYRGQRSTEAAGVIEAHLARLRSQPLAQVAPQIADALGDALAIKMAVGDEYEGEKMLRRLVDFSRVARDDTLFHVGMRKALAASALRAEPSRKLHRKLLERVLAALRKQEAFDTPAQLQERLVVAVLDSLGTSAMLDNLTGSALDYYREAQGRGLEVYKKIGAPKGKVKEALTVSCRIFPLVGLLSTHVLKEEVEVAANLSDILVPLAGRLNELGVLPEGHPAREAGDGALLSLRDGYARVQKARVAKTGEDLPISLEERLVRRNKAAEAHHAGHDHAGHDHAGHDHSGHDPVGHDQESKRSAPAEPVGPAARGPFAPKPLPSATPAPQKK